MNSKPISENSIQYSITQHATRNTPPTMAYLNLLSRRDFLSRSLRAGAALGLASLTQVPPFARRALAENGIGTNGKKLLFIFLRGANDALNSIIPVGDTAYNNTIRPNIYIPPKSGTDYTTQGIQC